jgi:hypothetical protein
MAKARAAAGRRPAAKPVKRRSRAPANRLLIILTVIALVPFSLPTLLVLVCGMLPTLVAAIAERSGQRYAWICVGGLNFAGLAPWLFDLWFGHHTWEFAVQLLGGISMLLTAYGASAVGWGLYLATPPVVTTVMSMTSRNRSEKLTAQQRKIVDQWGDGVVTPDELL